MANIRIKKALKNKNMKQWQLAKLMGINEFSLSRKLREELPDEETEKILRLIENGKYEYVEVVYKDDIDNASTIEPQKWIPVSERLPEIKGHHESDTVLCYTDMGIYTFSVLQENIFGQCGFACERDDDYHVSGGKVIAWMPLPAPYKEGEE